MLLLGTAPLPLNDSILVDKGSIPCSVEKVKGFSQKFSGLFCRNGSPDFARAREKNPCCAPPPAGVRHGSGQSGVTDVLRPIRHRAVMPCGITAPAGAGVTRESGVAQNADHPHVLRFFGIFLISSGSLRPAIPTFPSSFLSAEYALRKASPKKEDPGDTPADTDRLSARSTPAHESFPRDYTVVSPSPPRGIGATRTRGSSQ